MRLIDADALMDVMGIAVECESCPRNGVFGCGEDSAFVYACESITGAPTVDPIRHGRWMMTPTAWRYCSICGCEPPCETNIPTDYCPNCGAKMDEEKDNETD